MAASEEVLVHKITLSTDKVVLMREMKIRDQDLAAKAASSRVGDDSKVAIALAMQKELLKLLIVQIGDKKIRPIEMEDLDALFSYQEFRQLTQVLDKVTGGATDMGNAKIEFVNSGSI
jgi:hypothetical protein